MSFEVNSSKSKIIIFSSGRLPQNINFLYEFTYLGLNFSRTGSFTNAKKVLINKAYKAMYEVLKKGSWIKRYFDRLDSF
jgi:hypothetical protein